MARRALIDSRDRPYHVTARCNNREHFPGKLDEIWSLLTGELSVQILNFGIRIHAFVLMPNHFHLLLTTPQVPIHKTMKEFIGTSTKTINSKFERSGRIYGGPYHWSLIRTPLYYAHALKYVYRNPVRAHLCAGVADYPFSTFSGLLGREILPISIVPPMDELDRHIKFAFETPLDMEDWLNAEYRQEENEAIRKALRKKEFELDVDRVSRKPVDLPLPNDAVLLPEST